MGGFDVANGWTLFLNRIDEIGPQQLQVVSIGFLQLMIFVDDLLLGVGWIERPTITPTHVKDAFGSVEIGADGMFFGIVLGVFSMFPSGGE